MSTSPVPPKFVPTLTQVVHLNEAEPVLLNTVQLETGLVRRVMARVDATLDQLLRDAVERVILDHTQALKSRLHAEIELAVRSSVSQALAQEAG